MNKSRLLLVLMFIVCTTSVMGMAVNENAVGADIDFQHQRINAVRNEKLSEFAAEDVACLSRFAVTDCQNQVGRRRREMLSELKRQESRLNETDRRQKGLGQLQSSQEKAADRVQRQSAEPSISHSEIQAQRLQAQNEKVLNHKSQARPVVPVAPVNKLPSGLDTATIDSNRAAYAEKQRALEQRRLDREKRVLEKAGGSAALPRSP